VGGRLLARARARARPPRFGLVFSRTFYGGFGRFFPGRGRAAAPQQQRWQLAPAVAVVPASGSVQAGCAFMLAFSCVWVWVSQFGAVGFPASGSCVA
jgi:hypothetical protein